ncbi:MAG: hypothetical protein OXN89_07630 [Bryobacterales bacterium]|nr:hypothetical protein [Bryobacterales bacterium]
MTRRRFSSACVATALLFAPCLAQETFPLRVLEFEGNDAFSSADLAAVTGLEIGQMVAKPDFERALRLLNDTGAFESLRYRFGPQDGGFRLTIAVQELAELFPVRFQGLGVGDDEVEAVLREGLPLYAGKVPAVGPMVKMLVAVLGPWWEQQSGEGPIVADVVPASGGEGFEMLIGPRRQTNRIAFTTFADTGDVDALELQRVFNHAAVGEEYTEARLHELLQYNARPLYTHRGYMNVRFCPCEASPDPESEGVLVSVRVDQGDVYAFGEIAWPEPMPMDPDALARVSRISSGSVADMKAAYETMAAIGEGLKRHGYMKAHARFDEQVDHDTRLVHLQVHIDTGVRYVFSRLIIKGLDILSEPAVRKRWGMQPGQPFDVRYPAYFLDRIKADAMFAGLRRTSWGLDSDDSSGRVDVTLVFSGEPEQAR